MNEQHPNPYQGLGLEQTDFLDDGETLITGSNYARLDEALHRLDVEPSAHSFRSIAQEELEELYEEWIARGGLPEEFGGLCAWVTRHPWISPDGEEMSYIETPPGRKTYIGELGPPITVGEDIRVFFNLD